MNKKSAQKQKRPKNSDNDSSQVVVTPETVKENELTLKIEATYFEQTKPKK